MRGRPARCRTVSIPSTLLNRQFPNFQDRPESHRERQTLPAQAFGLDFPLTAVWNCGFNSDNAACLKSAIVNNSRGLNWLVSRNVSKSGGRSTSGMSRIRMGAVSYLNTKPLVEGLDALADRYEVVFDFPGRLADRLESGDLDVALIPSIEAVDRDYTIVSDACIACRGPVWSVKLMSRVSPEAIRTLALDEGSRTSRVLARILLEKQHGVRPDCTPLNIRDDWRESPADAVLIIGDRAMRAAEPEFPVEIDLGQAWNDWTGLPFVFAVWAAGNSAAICADRQKSLDDLTEVLTNARNEGLNSLHRIAENQHEAYDLGITECYDYLHRKLNFTLGDDGKAALEKYYSLAAELDLVCESTPLQFHGAGC